MNLGQIVGVSKNRHIILRTIDWQSLKHHPNIGDKVFTIEKTKIGMIYDIFGPKTKPYLSVKLFNSNVENIDDYDKKKGEFLYTFKEVKKFKKRPHHSSRPRSGPNQKRPYQNKGSSQRKGNKNPGFKRISPN